MSKAKMPPVPPAGRAPGGGAVPPPAGDRVARGVGEANRTARDRNLGEQGRQGNVAQNTTNQGYQQDR